MFVQHGFLYLIVTKHKLTVHNPILQESIPDTSFTYPNFKLEKVTFLPTVFCFILLVHVREM